jgi:hypothetical protein
MDMQIPYSKIVKDSPAHSVCSSQVHTIDRFKNTHQCSTLDSQILHNGKTAIGDLELAVKIFSSLRQCTFDHVLSKYRFTVTIKKLSNISTLNECIFPVTILHS